MREVVLAQAPAQGSWAWKQTLTRILILALLLAILTSPSRAQSTQTAAEDVLWSSVGTKIVASLPCDAVFLEEEFNKGARLVRLRGVRFSSRKVTFRVLVSPEPVAEDFPRLLKESGAFAGSNGGYFHPDFRPLGLVLSGGRELHAEQRAKLLSGLLLAGPEGLNLLRAGTRRPSGMREGLQSGPFLVEEGQSVSGLEATKTARRTFLATDGRQQWFLGVLSSCTLAEAGAILSKSQIFEDQNLEQGINLDGGSSTGLWIQSGQGSEDFLLRPLGAVSNYLGLFPLSP